MQLVHQRWILPYQQLSIFPSLAPLIIYVCIKGILTLTAKTRLGANCGSGHELLIAKFRLKLKKVGKTTTRFRYDLNQILYYYRVEVTNRFKELHLIDSA